MTKHFTSLIHSHALMLGLAFALAGAVLASSHHQNPPSRQNPPAGAEKEAKSAAPQSFGEITGRVVTEEGQPILNARVSASALGRTTPVSYSTTTDAEGNFRIPDLPLAAYNLSANAPGYVSPILVASSSFERPIYRTGESARITMIKGGVITGKVTDATGEAIPSLTIRAVRVRDAEGNLVAPTPAGQQRATDDRGIYRLYGLMPGTYVVMAAGLNRIGRPTEHEGEAPTFHPSATRDTAIEVIVRSGEEASGIDIRFRSERGHVIVGSPGTELEFAL